MRLLDAWRLALGTLTVVPVRPPTTVDRATAGLSMLLAPLAALPLGLVVVAVGVGGHLLDAPPLLSAAIAVAGVVLGNRAFHLDGLSDTVDGLAASFEPSRSLEVMKSGTSGPAGTAALVLVVAIQVIGLGALLGGPHPVAASVLAGAAVLVSRAALPLCCARGIPSARPGGLGDTFAGSLPRPEVAVVWLLAAAVLAGLGAWAGLGWWRGGVAVAIGAAVAGVLLLRTRRRLGGVTGDVFGAAVELTLAALLAALA
ncbi:MAG: adenosylcobinamide-GDP ribazoletransferase [Nocardioides sp.]|uniref:adenosylcobinamide-GDP ribazoletransferase n=1 Tax=Nocardioides sp. TaxID=35761 RepID=UPI0039E61EC8